MDPTLYLDAVRAVHLLGLAAGLGLALFADIWAARSFVKPVDDRDIAILHRLHVGISIGLALLWASGLALLQIRTGFDPAAFSPKLIAKLIVVVLLTMNAFVIGAYAMPLMKMTRGRTFAQNGFNMRLEQSSTAGVSASCWISAFALGVFTQMKPLGASDIGSIIGTIFLIVTGGALLFGIIAPHMARLLPGSKQHPAPDPAWGERLAEQAARPADIVPGLLSFPLKEVALDAARKSGRR